MNLRQSRGDWRCAQRSHCNWRDRDSFFVDFTFPPLLRKDGAPGRLSLNLRFVVNDDYVQETRAVDAFDARHLNVSGGAGARDICCKARYTLAEGEVFGQRFDDL